MARYGRTRGETESHRLRNICPRLFDDFSIESLNPVRDTGRGSCSLTTQCSKRISGKTVNIFNILVSSDRSSWCYDPFLTAALALHGYSWNQQSRSHQVVSAELDTFIVSRIWMDIPLCHSPLPAQIWFPFWSQSDLPLSPLLSAFYFSLIKLTRVGNFRHRLKGDLTEPRKKRMWEMCWKKWKKLRRWKKWEALCNLSGQAPQ